MPKNVLNIKCSYFANVKILSRGAYYDASLFFVDVKNYVNG